MVLVVRVLGLLVTLAILFTDFSYAESCSQVFSRQESVSVEVHSIAKANILAEFLKIGNQLVTDRVRYSVAAILKNLGVHEGLLGSKKVLSVGEGIGPLLPHLVKQGYDITGVDLFYFKNYESQHRIAQKIRQHEATFGKYLKRGDATELPLRDGSVDIYLSHAMVNNLSRAQKKQVLNEALRVVDSYGDIYISGFAKADFFWITQTLVKYKVASYQFEQVGGELNFGGGPFTYKAYRLIVRK